MHGAGILAQKAFFNREVLRVDCMRNVTVHAIEERAPPSDSGEDPSHPPSPPPAAGAAATSTGGGGSPASKARELSITGSIRISGVPTSVTVLPSVAPLGMLAPPFVGFNKHFDTLFRVSAISSRALVTCSDGSLHVITTVPLELGRLLIRLQTSMDRRGHCGASLQAFRRKHTTRHVNSSLHPQNFLNLNYIELFLSLTAAEREEIVRCDMQPENADVVTQVSLCQLLLLLGMVL